MVLAAHRGETDWRVVEAAADWQVAVVMKLASTEGVATAQVPAAAVAMVVVEEKRVAEAAKATAEVEMLPARRCRGSRKSKSFARLDD